MVLIGSATTKEREKTLGLFQMWTSEAAKIVHTKWLCSPIRAHFSGNYHNTKIQGETILHSQSSFPKFSPTRNFVRMILFARIENETWSTDPAFVDKLGKNNGLKFVLILQDLFDWTEDAKRVETKDSNETVLAFLTMITIRVNPKNMGRQGNKICKRVLKSSFAKLTEWKYTLQRVRIKLHLLTLQYDVLKLYFALTLKNIGTSDFTNCLNPSQPWTSEKTSR